MVIEKKKTAGLIPAEYNPRKALKPEDAEYEKLKRSIEQFGYVEPVIWNKTTGRVVGGSGSTLIACEQTDRICHTIELDEKSCDVIVKRYIEQVGSSDGVFLLRDGIELKMEDMEMKNSTAD